MALLPVRDLPLRDRADTSPVGLVVIRRTIPPQRGRLALPGGFIDHGETWQQAVTRELAEETGITARPEEVRLADALTDTDGGFLLLFGLLPARPAHELPTSRPTDETDGWQIITDPAELAFPLHTEAAARWFADGYGSPPPRTRTA